MAASSPPCVQHNWAAWEAGEPLGGEDLEPRSRREPAVPLAEQQRLRKTWGGWTGGKGPFPSQKEPDQSPQKEQASGGCRQQPALPFKKAQSLGRATCAPLGAQPSRSGGGPVVTKHPASGK